ncbi:MAG: UDP-N-acetylglucosamine--N-acetylmuramyl-(pentapeptide) pyrophosphoryl-undecaprenol N-acetylglucosamine transferase [Chloroflexi bacterium]|nr:UDP-N-acetylglucosamine--N-acetylmuramyl-(pentapeptide) pyrophosphoryl-undecaprenol N-acetylglucosamine transferase [Ardenticatenaceae bacterium]MBL1129463.1 UDP-N-acetylglucosamine--N-acetylmuramyl-(pentapeptide) pyrophosphoryl-undecaprenol N-acetylglucosamine transferase [Chloroflexota bacterium]NOG35543.1 UDP-N-acetylglucosamine--N-acetylmuramyl-(pentapeptide) pyrophosphoryl-undecaprenol N-acetylglucosamine transferase [Chloroflexota bacterium]GIK55702.1 MAG: UDP-N-acetylglucosamine--N-ace
MRVLICAGGTGGGIYPALAAATELQKIGIVPEDILWIGTKGEMEETLVPRAGLKLETISGGAIAGVPLPLKLKNGARLAASLPKSLRIVRRFRPDVMFMTGGYMAAPVTLACRALGVPIVIYLPDVEPGASVRFSLRFARKIGATTDGTAQFVPPHKLVVTGYPVRPELRAATQLRKEAALARFDLTPGRPTLFIFGGSRGAQKINRALMGCLPDLLARAQIIHVSGTLTWPEVAANWQGLSEEQKRWYRPYPYLHEEMGAAYRAADLVVARAGASMLGECPAFGLPAILIPLAWAWRYQKVNADYLTERGTAVQLTDDTLAYQLLPTILRLLDDPPTLARMRAAARALDKPDGAERLAQLIIQNVKRKT